MLQSLTFTQPDDWHLHLRDGVSLGFTSHYTARQFGRAIIMPNLSTPVTSVDSALAYRERILSSLPTELEDFNPLMTLYLTDSISTSEIEAASSHPHVHAAKLYPAGATTNSEHGVTDIKNIYPLLEAMQQHDLPLLVHGEVVDNTVDVFDREQAFIGKILSPLRETFPALRIVFEHITTSQAVDFVLANDNIAATITAHHLLYNRNAIFTGGLRPHHYCLPVLKRESHRQALVNAATSGNPKFFLGTDSAPHSRQNKENACGCAGIFTAHTAIEIYTQVFDHAGALDMLETFASFNGADFYQLPRNEKVITLNKQTTHIPESLPYENDSLIPFLANETIDWKLSD